ncbi:MAG: PspC domain-containing protein [Spirochaetales bacterium]|nr:PspC domain-containing protein [Spirochaetales bacterium]
MKIYRSHEGLFLGVCQGMEESLGIPARYTRFLLIILAIIFKAWIILAIYLLAALLLPIPSTEEWKIQDNFETLGRDARTWSRREWEEIRVLMRRAAGPKASEEPDDHSEEV